MWWRNYLIVFLITSVLVVVTMLSCSSSNTQDEQTRLNPTTQVKSEVDVNGIY